MKTGDIVYFVNENWAGQLAVYKIEVDEPEKDEYVSAEIIEIYFDNYPSRKLKINGYYNFPLHLVFVEKDIHKYKLMKWIFATLRRDK